LLGQLAVDQARTGIRTGPRRRLGRSRQDSALGPGSAADSRQVQDPPSRPRPTRNTDAQRPRTQSLKLRATIPQPPEISSPNRAGCPRLPCRRPQRRKLPPIKAPSCAGRFAWRGRSTRSSRRQSRPRPRGAQFPERRQGGEPAHRHLGNLARPQRPANARNAPNGIRSRSSTKPWPRLPSSICARARPSISKASLKPANGRTSPVQDRYTTEVVLRQYRGELTCWAAAMAAAGRRRRL
jgi:hypothetical protein